MPFPLCKNQAYGAEGKGTGTVSKNAHEAYNVKPCIYCGGRIHLQGVPHWRKIKTSTVTILVGIGH